MVDKLSRPIISVPVTLQRRESKRLMKQRAKELEAKHSKYYRGDRKSPALIQCRRQELNHYRGQVYSPFNRLPLATEHWMSRSTIGEYVLVAVTFKQIFNFNLFYMYSLQGCPRHPVFLGLRRHSRREKAFKEGRRHSRGINANKTREMNCSLI